MIYGYDKPLYIFKYGTSYFQSDSIEENRARFWESEESHRLGGYLFYLGKKDSLNKIIQSKRVPLKKGSVLYFGKTSEFPRFKLANNQDYKRCIKLDKADVVVVRDHIPSDYSGDSGIFIEDSKALYMISSDWYLNSVRFDARACRTSWEQDAIQFMIRNHLFFGENPKICYKGFYIGFEGKNNKNDILNILNGTYTDIVFDSDVDTEINKTLPVLTEADIESINDLFRSSDTASQELGLKLLTGYNVQATPVTVRTLIGQYERLRYLNAWNSVGVTQVLESVHWTGFIQFPTYISNALQYEKNKTYDENDLKLCRKLYARAAATVIDAAIKRVVESGMNQIFNFDIRYEIS